MKWKNGLAVSASLVLAACSGGGDQQPGDPVAVESEAAADAVGEITSQYLAGDWCYLRYEAGGEVSEENITYVFAADGTLKTQTNSGTPVDVAGSYELKEGVVVIKPALAFFKLVPVAVTDDGMILEAMGGQFFWKRGACGA